jgi:Protein kinase domain
VELQLAVDGGPGAGQVLVVRPGQTRTVGSGPESELVLPDKGLAGRHLEVVLGVRGARIRPLAPGVKLNDRSLQEGRSATLRAGDELLVGRSRLRCEVLLVGGQPVEVSPLDEATDELATSGLSRLSLLGEGGSGRVYRAWWEPAQRWVAVKLLDAGHEEESLEYKRFLREAETVARLDSPYVVKVHDVRRSAVGRPYSIMELVEGPSLGGLLQRRPLHVVEALRVAEDVARALAAAAGVGVVHRDVKPGNVLIDRRGARAKLCDFGLAKDLDVKMETLTKTGIGLGTLAYLPPEQMTEARHARPSADVYSLGATLYHMLAGRPPFEPTNGRDLLKIVRDAPPSLHARRPDCPPQVVGLVHVMLSKDPEERPDAKRVASGLRRIREQVYPDADLGQLFGAPSG